MRLAMPVAFLLLLGLGSFTVKMGNAFSYAFDDPAACMNCHIMRSEFASWHASQHRQPVVCNDCHVPHEIPDKFVFKALDGLRHGAVFTLATAPENIRMRDESKHVVDANCRRCHGPMLASLPAAGDKFCFDCHRSIPHG